MSNRILTYCFLLIFAFNSCKKKEIDSIIQDKIIGNWKIKNNEYDKEYLEINSDNTFYYKGVGHLNESFAKGRWKVVNDSLVLNSITPKECLYVVNFGTYCEHANIVIEEKINTTFDDCEPQTISKLYKAFNDTRFILKKDTMFYVEVNKNCSNKLNKIKLYR